MGKKKLTITIPFVFYVRILIVSRKKLLKKIAAKNFKWFILIDN